VVGPVLPEIADFLDLDLRDELHEHGAETGAEIDEFGGVNDGIDR
jgi:hypothetical protein